MKNENKAKYHVDNIGTEEFIFKRIEDLIKIFGFKEDNLKKYLKKI